MSSRNRTVTERAFPYCVAVLTLIVVACAFVGIACAEFNEIQKIVADIPMPGSSYGRNLAFDGDLLVVGARFEGGEGAAYVYRFDGSTWNQEQRLAPPPESTGLFGFTVEVDDDRIFVTAPREQGTEEAVYVYEHDGGEWVEVQRIQASDLSPIAFGQSLAASGDRLLVGASFAGDPPTGAAYVFHYDGSTWVEEQRLVASDAAEDDTFGLEVALQGQTAFVGTATSLGAVYVFDFDGTSWTEGQKLEPLDESGSVGFGASFEVLGDTLLVGAPNGSPSGTLSGAAYVFRFDGTMWTEEQKILPEDAALQKLFGNAVGLRENVAVIAARSDDEIASQGGAFYVFRFDGVQWIEDQKSYASDAANFLEFGRSLALDGETLMVGSPNAEDDAGAVYFFSEKDCRTGTVDLANGSQFPNVLYVERTTGGSDRMVEISEGQSFDVAMLRPVSGGNGRFVLHAEVGPPASLLGNELPFEVGLSCLSFLSNGSASPVIVANNLGKRSVVGESHYFGSPTPDPEIATTELLFPPLPIGTVMTLQALVIDPASMSPKGVSVTNAVVLEVVP